MNTLVRDALKLAALTLLALLATTGIAGASPPEPASAPQLWSSRGPKNVIVMIGDGAGHNHVEAANLYQYGRTNAQLYQHFPVRLGMSTYSGTGHGYDPALAWSDFDYVRGGATDSAAAATAMSTGVKTYNGAIGLDMDRNAVGHVIERAEELGKATGVVSSVQFSHATPAAFVAHDRSRNNYEAIAREMILDSAVDVIMGAGHPLYTSDGVPAATPDYRYVGGQTTWEALVAETAGGDADGDGVANPWALVESRAQFQELTSGSTPSRVIGVAQVRTTLQQSRAGTTDCDSDGDIDAADIRICAPYTDPFLTGVPTLEEMTRAALNVLDNDRDGFFLMVEGGAIDWASHANQNGRLIEEVLDFNQSVEAVVNWVHRHSNWGETVVMVTGDHETGYLLGPGSDPTWESLVNNGRGNLPGMEWHSGSHTNSLIPLFAKGRGTLWLRAYANQYDPVRGPYVDNTEIAKFIFRVWGGGAPSKSGVWTR